VTRRPRNPRVVATAYARTLKKSAEDLTWALSHAARRDVFIPLEERPADDRNTWQRPRRPEEHADVRPDVFLDARRRLIRMSHQITETDRLLRYKLATLGCDARGVHVGADVALDALSEDDVWWLNNELGTNL
jgi:hypothetical protein